MISNRCKNVGIKKFALMSSVLLLRAGIRTQILVPILCHLLSPGPCMLCHRMLLGQLVAVIVLMGFKYVLEMLVRTKLTRFR